MTTTAFDDQYLSAPEPVREPMSREAILKRNVADLEIALRTQTELKERAEAELAKLAQQNPVAWCDPVEFKDDPWSFQGFRCRTNNYPTMPLFAAPVPTPAVPAAYKCSACGKSVTAGQRADNDGDCPHCNNEIDISDALLQSTETPKPTITHYCPKCGDNSPPCWLNDCGSVEVRHD